MKSLGTFLIIIGIPGLLFGFIPGLILISLGLLLKKAADS